MRREYGLEIDSETDAAATPKTDLRSRGCPDDDSSMYTDISEKQFQTWREQPSSFIEAVIGVEPFDYQKEFLDTDASRKAFVSGRQVGKSRSCAWLAIHHALFYPDSTSLLVAPTQRQSSELMKQIKKEISNSELTSEAWGIGRDIQTEVSFDNGSRILSLPTGRDGGNIRGYTADLVIADEAAFIGDDIFEQVLEPMLVVTDGALVLASTPFGESGFFYRKVATDDDYFVQQVPTSTNPLVDDEFIEKQREQLPSMEFHQEYLGEFVSSADKFFAKDDIKKCLTHENFVNRESGIAYLGADVAQHGEDSSVYVSMDQEGNVYDIVETQDTDLTDAIGRIQALDNANQYTKILVDSTGLGTGVVDTVKERIGRKVEGYKFNSIDKKQNLYQNARHQMQDGDITFPLDDEGRKLKEQLSGMKQSFTSTGKIKVEEPDQGHDDFADAFVLACWARQEGRRTGNEFKGLLDMGSYGPAR